MMNRFSFIGLCACMSLAVWSPTMADETNSRNNSPNQKKVQKEKIKKKIPSPNEDGCPTALFPEVFRTIDGTGNNCLEPTRGSAPIELLRLTTVGYADGQQTPSGENRPDVRTISNTVADQGEQDISYRKRPRYSDYVWQWGQFLDHDLDLTPIIEPIEPFDVAVPRGDSFFDPEGNGNETIAFERSLYVNVDGIRQQVNHITAFIDASNVYGSDTERANALRTLDGTGKLKTSRGNLLPFNVPALPNAMPPGLDPGTFFLAGDFRANEQVGLTAMHTLFVRDHNYWVDYFHEQEPNLNGDQLYERARAMVAAEMQHITYEEFVPLLLGKKALGAYRGYKPDVNPGISNVFATAAYRFGHSLVASTIQRLNRHGQSIGSLPVRQAFFNPSEISSNGIEPLLRGLAVQSAQRYDIYMVHDLRNFLFGAPGEGGFDLASLNMQRGRDHGLPGFNQIREIFGLGPVKTFQRINPNQEVQNRLKAAYGNVEEMDLWIAGLAEKPLEGAIVGETVFAILKDQFQRLREGDRFWYERYLPGDLVKLVKTQSLAKVIRRNTRVGKEIQENVFLAP